jgi:hypothetical protein
VCVGGGAGVVGIRYSSLALRGWLFTCSWGAALLTAFERGLVVVMIIARGQ